MEIGRERVRAAGADYAVMIVVGLLTLFGVLIVYSASFAFGALEFDDPYYFVLRQSAFAMMGAGAMFITMRANYRRLRMVSLLLLLGAMGLLFVTLIPGIGFESNGAQRWISLGPLPPLQPSEFAKLALVIYVADWLSSKGDDVESLSLGVLPFIVVVGPIAALVMMQPDMGTMLVLLLITGTQFFVGGASPRHIAALIAAGGFAGGLLIAMGDYRVDRFNAFISPESDASGSGFHILQLLIALGSGGMTGVEWGESRQKFFYVPGAHTDGIFAIIGEELGFIGAIGVLVLFGILVYRSLRIASRARDEFGYLLAVGITAWLSFQTLLNIGGITRSIPMTGVPLPFLSYGGSALISTMTAVGLLLSISRFGREPDEGPPPRRAHERVATNQPGPQRRGVRGARPPAAKRGRR